MPLFIHVSLFSGRPPSSQKENKVTKHIAFQRTLPLPTHTHRCSRLPLHTKKNKQKKKRENDLGQISAEDQGCLPCTL